MLEIMNRFKAAASLFFIFILILFSLNTGCSDSSSKSHKISLPDPETDWTIMVYGDGDNDLEQFLLLDVEEMKEGFINGQGYNLIILADRIASYSDSEDGFNANFTDTRLYRITEGKVSRIGGSTQFPDITTSSRYEANMGDAQTLKKFIQFCKGNYPADHYALIIWNHGTGVAKKGTENTYSTPDKGVCVDLSSPHPTLPLVWDSLYTAEITDVLTSAESVDLLGFDACLMGSIEIAYQYRPDAAEPAKFSGQIMAASAPSVWGAGWKYDEILQRIKTGGGTNEEPNNVSGSATEAIYDPVSMTAADLCEIIVEEQYDSVTMAPDQSMSCYDLSKAGDVKTAVDALAVQLHADYVGGDLTIKNNFETIRGPITNPLIMHYYDESNTDETILFPFFDLYDLAEHSTQVNGVSAAAEIRAGTVMTQVDSMILCSFGGSLYSGFLKGKNGMFIFFPDGDETYGSHHHWYYQWFYNAITIDETLNDAYGRLAWCKYDKNGYETNGTPAEINVVENWFELLDSWFDILANGGDNDADGGLNGYQW